MTRLVKFNKRGNITNYNSCARSNCLTKWSRYWNCFVDPPHSPDTARAYFTSLSYPRKFMYVHANNALSYLSFNARVYVSRDSVRSVVIGKIEKSQRERERQNHLVHVSCWVKFREARNIEPSKIRQPFIRDSTYSAWILNQRSARFGERAGNRQEDGGVTATSIPRFAEHPLEWVNLPSTEKTRRRIFRIFVPTSLAWADGWINGRLDEWLK